MITWSYCEISQQYIINIGTGNVIENVSENDPSQGIETEIVKGKERGENAGKEKEVEIGWITSRPMRVVKCELRKNQLMVIINIILKLIYLLLVYIYSNSHQFFLFYLKSDFIHLFCNLVNSILLFKNF